MPGFRSCYKQFGISRCTYHRCVGRERCRRGTSNTFCRFFVCRHRVGCFCIGSGTTLCIQPILDYNRYHSWSGRRSTWCVAYPGWYLWKSQFVATTQSNPNGVWWMIIALYVSLLAAGFWYPFDVISDPALIRVRLAGIFQIPLSSLYWGSEFNATNLILAWTLLYAILGAGVSTLFWFRAKLGVSKRVVLLVSSASCFCVALVIEMGQLFIASRGADITQVLVCTMGGVLGTLIAIRLGKEFKAPSFERQEVERRGLSDAASPSHFSAALSHRFFLAFVLASLAVLLCAVWLSVFNKNSNASRRGRPSPADISGVMEPLPDMNVQPSEQGNSAPGTTPQSPPSTNHPADAAKQSIADPQNDVKPKNPHQLFKEEFERSLAKSGNPHPNRIGNRLLERSRTCYTRMNPSTTCIYGLAVIGNSWIFLHGIQTRNR